MGKDGNFLIKEGIDFDLGRMEINNINYIIFILLKLYKNVEVSASPGIIIWNKS